jgi:class 3 adenylate cyclase
MPAEVKKEIQLEIAHVLFTDIVGYSKLPINEQRALVERLNEIVRGTDEFQAAETAGRLIKIPTGDGITLVFYQSPEAPVECALEISRALKKDPELQLRMGIHSGPVSGVIDVTGKANVAGAGINMAQRVMDCGDAGHILLSKHVAEDLEQYPHWQPYLHELGECEVKHGVRVSVVNLYTQELGNPAAPEKFKAARLAAAARRKRAALRRLSLGAVGLLVALAAISFLLVRYKRSLTAVELAAPVKTIAIARRALPNDPSILQLTGWIGRRQGVWEESTRNLEHAIELDPRNVFLLQEIAQSYQALHRYDQMASALDRAVQINTNDVNARVIRAGIDLYRHADPRPARTTIETILADDHTAADKIASFWVYVALCERDTVALDRALAALDDHAFGQNQIVLSRAFGEGLLARMKGDANAARNAFLAARDGQEQKVRAQPDYAAALVVLGSIDAELGRRDDALREGRRAIELCPIARDAINGTDVLEYFAIICASTGEKDLAIEQLNLLLQHPCFLSYGDLRLHPFWDPLRGDLRFEKIVASLAPKEATSK